MFDGNDLSYVERALNKNEVVLFLGAGFSREAINLTGTNLPGTPELCKVLWRFLEYHGEWEGASLKVLFEAALKWRKGHDALNHLLSQELVVKEVPEWYNFLTKVYWNRIYTTNVDNLVEEVFRKAGAKEKLSVIVGTLDEYEERDQLLHSTQYVKLNGSLPGLIDKLTFSVMQYARRSASFHDIWYDHFVRDYVTHPTLFVGTELNEPLLMQYLAVREGRLSRDGSHLDFPERRPKSYLISPRISEPNREFLKTLNIVGVEATAREFFEWLFSQIRQLYSRSDILKRKYPDLATELQAGGDRLNLDEIQALEDFFKSFQRVPEQAHRSDHPKNYLLGFTPTWQDITNNYDAPREITKVVIDKLGDSNQKKAFQVFTLIGSAGSGKSTILMRSATHLSREGFIVFYSNGMSLPLAHNIRRVLNLIPGYSILIVDNGEIAAPIMPEILEQLQTSERPPVVLLASQANLYDRLERRLAGPCKPELIAVPHMSPADIDNILRVLDHNGLLGKLQGKSLEEQRYEFRVRAKSQILVAMREATRGLGFDQIIQDEYMQITPSNARTLLLCVALASAVNFKLNRGQYIACSDSPDFESMGYLDINLRDVVVTDPSNPDLLSTRHSLIAKHIVEKVATKDELCEAYIRLLTTLSHDFSSKSSKRSSAFRLYQLILNHRTIFDRFEIEIEYARKIFEAIKNHLKHDWQFWLQYGSLELEYGELSLAENYLDQAYQLKPDADFITHAHAHLWLKQSIIANSIVEAVDLRKKAEQVLNKQFEKERLDDPYPYHILCSQLMKWIRTWVTDLEQKRTEIKCVREYIKVARKRFPWNERLAQLEDEIHKEYLYTAVN
jgi:tetratricopeptide (TPR) repeat protein